MPKNIENLSQKLLLSVEKVETLLDNKAENAQKYQESLKIPPYYRSKKSKKLPIIIRDLRKKSTGGGFFQIHPLL